MEKAIGGLEDLRPILASLKRKNLIVELTSPGRGQMVTHHVYPPAELAQLRQQFAAGMAAGSDDEPDEDFEDGGVAVVTTRPSIAMPEQANEHSGVTEKLRQRVDGLETIVADLRNEVAELKRLIES